MGPIGQILPTEDCLGEQGRVGDTGVAKDKLLAPRIAVLATSFNRAEVTLRGLTAMRTAAAGVEYRVWLVDDGSTDRTGEAVRAGFPEVTVLNGDGSLFWNGGMRLAWQAAQSYRPDYYLWWNDDLELLPNSVALLLNLQRAEEVLYGPRVIAVGKVIDPETHFVTYGGYVRVPGLSRLRFARVSDDGVSCATMNGNLVLIPARAVDEIGILSEHYRHGTGDIDYGLRASQTGYRILQSAFPVGYTAFNIQYHEKISRLTWSNRDFIFRNPKGIPIKEWLYFCRMHGGRMWPINFVGRYLKIVRYSV